MTNESQRWVQVGIQFYLHANSPQADTVVNIFISGTLVFFLIFKFIFIYYRKALHLSLWVLKMVSQKMIYSNNYFLRLIDLYARRPVYYFYKGRF